MDSFLLEKLKESKYTDVEIDDIIEGLMTDRFTTLRLNTLKCKNIDEIIKCFNEKNIRYTKNNNFKDALILDNLDSKKKDILQISEMPIYKEGLVYLQSLSSMLPVYVLTPKANENILDMCAAPGSKTTYIQCIANNKANLTAVELHKDRYERLSYNVKMQGANVYLINRNALDLDDMLKFDKILLDAPCSGTGTLELNDDNYKKYFTDKLIEKCVNTQKRLIKKAYKLLKDGGELIYSTCSLLEVENESMLEFAKMNGFEIGNCSLSEYIENFDANLFSKHSVIDKKEYIKIFPDRFFEGFFITKLVKI